MNRIVWVPGVWDLLHVGHVIALERAASFGDYLVVSVPSDEVVKEDKGHFPIIPLNERVEMLNALRCVTCVFPRYELDFIDQLNALKPNVIVVSEGWGTAERHTRAEQWAFNNGAWFIKIPYYQGESTRQIKKRIIDQRSRAHE